MRVRSKAEKVNSVTDLAPERVWWGRTSCREELAVEGIVRDVLMLWRDYEFSRLGRSPSRL